MVVALIPAIKVMRPPGQLCNHIEEFFAVAVAQRVVLTGSTADNQTANAMTDQAVDHRGQGREVNGTLLGERSYDRGPDAIKVHVITTSNNLYLLWIST